MKDTVFKIIVDDATKGEVESLLGHFMGEGYAVAADKETRYKEDIESYVVLEREPMSQRKFSYYTEDDVDGKSRSYVKIVNDQE